MSTLSLKRIIASVAVVAGVVFMLASPVKAADTAAAAASTFPIAVVDMNKVLQVSDAAKNARDQLEAKRKEYQDQISAKESALRSTEQELIKQKPSMSEADFNKKREEFEGKVVEAQKLVQEHKKSLDVGFNNSLSTLQNEVAAIVGDIAKERKFLMVMSNDGVVLAERSLDITDEVLTRLNKKIKKLPVDWSSKESKKK